MPGTSLRSTASRSGWSISAVERVEFCAWAALLANVNAIGVMTRAAIAFLYMGVPPGSGAGPPKHNPYEVAAKSGRGEIDSFTAPARARYCDEGGSGIDSPSGRWASAQPSAPSGYQTTLEYPIARIRFA